MSTNQPNRSDSRDCAPIPQAHALPTASPVSPDHHATGWHPSALLFPGAPPTSMTRRRPPRRVDPTTPSEDQLILRMAQHFWLFNTHSAPERCLSRGFTTRQTGAASCYQTSNDRGYHQCLATLLKLKGVGQSRKIGFESQIARSLRECGSGTAERSHAAAERQHRPGAAGQTRSHNDAKCLPPSAVTARPAPARTPAPPFKRPESLPRLPVETVESGQCPPIFVCWFPPRK